MKRIVIACIAAIFILPVLLCVTSIWLYPWGMSIYHRADIARIERRYYEFATLLKHRNDEEAYSYMSPSYQRTHSYSDFIEDKRYFIRGAGSWPIMHPHRTIWVQGNRGTIFLGYGPGFFVAGTEYALIRENGEWYFTGESEIVLD